MSVPKYKLQFYRASKEFIGLLKLFKNGKLVAGAKWKARSGHLGFRSYWTQGKSPIPASDSIEGSYAVEPGYVPGYVSAMGNWYYHITPDPIQQKNGTGSRSEIGIHEDANFATSPGTAGCIGIDPEDWTNCRKMLDAVFVQEKKTNPNYRIPLEVIYGDISAIQEPKPEKTTEQPEKPQVAQKTPFQKALMFTLGWEGGYVNHPSDPGGATNKGITQSTYSRWRQKNNYPIQEVSKITDAEVQTIYLQEYWTASRADQMCEPLAIVHFDTAVNFGVGGAGEFLQEAIGFKGSDVDGMIGPVTMAKLKNGKDNKTTAMRIIEGRIAWRDYYTNKHPDQKVFLRGWLNRDFALKRLIRDNY